MQNLIFFVPQVVLNAQKLDVIFRLSEYVFSKKQKLFFLYGIFIYAWINA